MDTYKQTKERERRMKSYEEYIQEIEAALVGVLDDDYPDTINNTIVAIMDRDDLSDVDGEMIWEAFDMSR